jgi:hypothetical protein
MKIFNLRTPIGAIALSILASNIQQGSANEEGPVFRRRELGDAASIPLDISDLSLGSLSFIHGLSPKPKASKTTSMSMSMSKAAKRAKRAKASLSM